MAAAYACRSATLPVHRLRPGGNVLLLGAIASSAVALAGFLLIPPLADVLDQAPPPAAGFAVALLAIPAVWSADGIHKARRARARRAVARTRERDALPSDLGPRPSSPPTLPPTPPPDPPRDAQASRRSTSTTAATRAASA
jgi:hypothetical protein